MKYLITLILTLLVGCIASDAEVFTIKMLNSDYIMVNGHKLGVGDKFDDTALIEWNSDRQAVKVLSSSNEVYVVSSRQFKKNNYKCFADFLTYRKDASVRDIGMPVTLNDHRKVFQQDFVLLDTIFVNVGWRVDDNSYFSGKSSIGDESVSFIIPCRGSQLLFTRNLLAPVINGDSLTLSIDYVEKAYGDTTRVADAMKIFVAGMPR